MDQDLKEISVESFWGALSAFMVLQVLGFILYQGFKFEQPLTFLIFSFVLLGFLWFQMSTMHKVKKFLTVNGAYNIHSPSTKEFIKLFIGILALVVLIAFSLGYYPFPKNYSFSMGTVIYFIVSWLVSFVLSKLTIWKNIQIKSQVIHGYKRILAMLLMIPIFGISLFPLISSDFFGSPIDAFYSFPLIPLGTFFILLTSWLIEK